MSASERLRLVCPLARKQIELWGGLLLVAAAAVLLVVDPGAWGIAGALVLAALGAAIAWHGYRYKVPVLEVGAGEFRYRRGRYLVRIPFQEVGSYYLVEGRALSLGLCTPAGEPRVFRSVEGRRARRPFLPLTRSTTHSHVEEFMAAAGIPPRLRAITANP